MLPGTLSRVDEQAPAYCHPADPKALFDGIHHNEASVHSALNHPRALEECLKRTGVSPAEIANKLDPDGDRRPLHWAAARGHTQCVQLLLEAGADPQALDVHGATAAQLGMWHEECSALLPSISAYPAAAAIVAAQVAAAAASSCATRSDSFGTSGSCQSSGECSSSGAASSRSSERLRPGMKQMPDGRVVMTKAAKKREARARREAEAAQREAREDDCLGGALLEALGDERPVAGDSIGGRGRFTAEEDAAYLALLNQFGRPKKKENPEAWAAFGKAFPNRSPSSWTAHINAFSQAPSGLWQKRTTGPAERRKAPSGGLYTKVEFVALYGGRAEWDAAAAGAVGPAAPAAHPGAGGGGGRLPHTSGSWWPPLPVLYQPPISQGGAQAGSSRALPPVSPAVARKLEWWVAAKRRRDFVTSDQLRAEIMRDAGFNPEDGRPVPGWLPPGPGWFAGGYV